VSRFVRAETPPNFDDYRKYRPFLRRDFRHLCAYCERSEAVLGGEESFEIDHFRPKKFLDLITHYPNLYYACGGCNRHKSGTWPSEGLLAKGFRFADPCQEDMYVEHLQESTDGSLEAQTACGEYTRDQIRLNRSDLRHWRQLRREIAAELRTFESLKNDLEDMLAIAAGPIDKDKIREQLTAIEATIARRREQFSL
jgi:hypothetical protein